MTNAEPAPPDLASRILDLANDVLTVRTTAPNLMALQSNSESKSILGRVKVTFEGVVKLDPAKREVNYWDAIKKTSSGWGGGDDSQGFSKETFVLNGIERSGNGMGFVPLGSTYAYDFGKVRELVRALAVAQGWTFKTRLFKPK